MFGLLLIGGYEATAVKSNLDSPFCGRVRFLGVRSRTLTGQRYDAPRGPSIFGRLGFGTGYQEILRVPELGKRVFEPAGWRVRNRLEPWRRSADRTGSEG
jgi:hypothetical protein